MISFHKLGTWVGFGACICTLTLGQELGNPVFPSSYSRQPWLESIGNPANTGVHEGWAWEMTTQGQDSGRTLPRFREPEVCLANPILRGCFEFENNSPSLSFSIQNSRYLKTGFGYAWKQKSTPWALGAEWSPPLPISLQGTFMGPIDRVWTNWSSGLSIYPWQDFRGLGHSKFYFNESELFAQASGTCNNDFKTHTYRVGLQMPVLPGLRVSLQSAIEKSGWDYGIGLTGRLGPNFDLGWSTRNISGNPTALGIRWTSQGIHPSILPNSHIATWEWKGELAGPRGNIEESWFSEKQPSIDGLLDQLQLLGEDPKVKGLFLKLGYLKTDFASAVALHDGLIHFKNTGKKLFVYLDALGPVNLSLAAVADHLALHPEASLMFQGFSSETWLFGSTLEAIGVEAQFLKVGDYKSAPEIFTRNTLSKEARKDLQDYLNSLRSHFFDQFAMDRKLNRDSLESFMATHPLNAKQLKTAHWVDTLVFAEQASDWVKDVSGLKTLMRVSRTNPALDIPKKKQVEILVLEGEMVDRIGESGWSMGDDVMAAEAVTAILQRIVREQNESKTLDGLILYINSPGGSARAAETIWQSLQQFKAKTKIPVYAVIGAMAASGGYYIAAAADKIYAYPPSLVGSIGIFFGKMNAGGLMKKLKIGVDPVKTDSSADFSSITRAWRTDEVSVLQSYLDSGYAQFKNRVSLGRKKLTQSIDSLAQGRIYTAKTAITYGMVDGIGGMLQADSALRAELGDLPKQTISYSTTLATSPPSWTHGLRIATKAPSLGQTLDDIRQKAMELGRGQLLMWNPVLSDWQEKSL